MKLATLCRRTGVAAVLMTVLAGCGPREEEAVAPPAPRVSVDTLAAVPWELTEDLPGRVTPFQVADIRAQVGGIVQRRLFEQGHDVEAGQALFEINPAPFQADVDTAQAALQKAEAELANARNQSSRLETLVRNASVSRQAYDDAVATAQQAAANVAEARATLARRRLDLEFATVTSPIAGRVDQAMVTEGTLVGSADTTAMARVQNIDQVYVDVRRPSSSLTSLQGAMASRPSLDGGMPVTLLGQNGEPLEMSARLLFSGIEVDASTGNLLLRVLAENPQHRLLPGMFLRARVPYAQYDAALTVAQQAVVRIGGHPYVWVMDESERVEMVAVELGETKEGRYRVKSGLTEGQKVVVEGIERLSDGAKVSAADWAPAAPGSALVASAH
ncbi:MULTISPECIES: efflux RND transporter periplasmic adaptor subunit [unclassified Halomonas]|uniref:efflux RND transporter periplasmic adaptor subunit n=1 Tax=unclassified Halomonas TaxID=2609666 RepID=UPI00209FC742|nr:MULTISPECIES: efflux RND transporter periplasmic adaptor subunit [unclassified Halomonas]MCP1315717.1 efflux RND transporter periplasmic adaptor subunit [Halomonas sp. 707D7]MCP1326755.1 efflux RND transporter periplasmic adaptor subunit [Halomonas sp. 707D4]